MNLTEIKAALKAGKKVYWSNSLYEVKKSKDDYVIQCKSNNHCIGLTWTDGVTLNGKEEDFYISN